VIGSRQIAESKANFVEDKLARMAWAMMAKNERYQEPAALAA
jgi:transposase